MTRTSKLITNTVGGELSPEMQGRFDLGIYQKGLSKLENFISLAQGGARYRPGTFFVNYTAGNNPAVLIPFKFSNIQAYMIEATNGKFRFFKNNGAILESNKNVTAMTSASPAVFTVTAHGYSNGDTIFLSGLVGPTSLNSQYYVVANVTANTFTCKDIFGNGISAARLAAYVSGGTVARVYTISTPYLTADLPLIQFAQSADTMYIVHPKYKPRKLTRAGDTSWTIGTFTRTGTDPFINNTDGDGNCPSCITFIDSSRIIYGGTINNPSTLWASSSPASATGGTSQFDNFTLGAVPTNAIAFTLAPVHGEVDAIQWLANTSLFLAVGTYGSVRILYGNTTSEAISPVSVTAKSVTDFGVAQMAPVATGTTLLYVQRNQRILRSIDYDFLQNWYVTSNKNLAANHLTVPGYAQVVIQRALPDVIWSLRQDGRLLGLTFDQKENINSWHRHYFGGKSTAVDGTISNAAKILSMGVEPRPAKNDQMWFSVQRVINGNTVNSVEYMSDWLDYPQRQDYYTGGLEAADDTYFNNAMFEVQKGAMHLDMATGYEGTTLNTLTLTAPTTSGVSAWGLAGIGTAGLGAAWQWDCLGNVNSYPIGLAGGGNLLGLAVDGENNIMYACQQAPGGTTLALVSAPITLPANGANATLFANQIAYGGFQLASVSGANCNPMVLNSTGTYLYVLASAGGGNFKLLKISTATGQIEANSATLAVTTGDSVDLRMTSDDASILFVNKIGTIAQFESNRLATIFTQALGITSVLNCALSTDNTVFAFVDTVNNNLYSLNLNTHVLTTSAIPNANLPIEGAIDFPANDNAHVILCSAIVNAGTQNQFNTFSLAGALVTTYPLPLVGGIKADHISPAVKWVRVEPVSGILLGVSENAAPGDLFGYNFGTSLVTANAGYPSQISNINSITVDRTNIPVPTQAGQQVVLTANAGIFTVNSVGQQVWKKYLADGSGGGRIAIQQYHSATQVLGVILSALDTNAVMASGNWRLTTQVITGLAYLEGETVSVAADGGAHRDLIVQNGSITLDSPASVAFVGYGYVGTVASLNLDPGANGGNSAQDKPRNVWQVIINMVNSLGFSIGTTFYNLDKFPWRKVKDLTDRPPPPFSGNKRILFSDNTTLLNKQIVILQTEPLPCTVDALDVYMAVTDDF